MYLRNWVTFTSVACIVQLLLSLPKLGFCFLNKSTKLPVVCEKYFFGVTRNIHEMKSEIFRRHNLH